MDGAEAHLFVYGTLTRTAGHPMGARLRAHSAYVGPGAIRARRYVIRDPDGLEGAYPGALPSGSRIT